MPRIRTVKPGFFRSLTLSELEPRTRLTFVGLWCYVDDSGRGVDDPRLVKAEVWPLDDDVPATLVESDLKALAAVGVLHRYQTDDGRRYIHVSNWAEHQRISHPTDSDLPVCPCAGGQPPPSGEKPEDSVKPHEPLRPEGKGKEGKGREGECEGEAAEPQRPRKRATPPPTEFTITSDMRDWARREVPRVDVNQQTRQFLDHHRAKGSSFKDWTAAWRTWMRKADGWLPATTASAPAVPDGGRIPTCPDCGVGPTRTCARRRPDCTWATPTDVRSNGNNGGELRVLRAAP
jgi:hypothetical protein